MPLARLMHRSSLLLTFEPRFVNADPTSKNMYERLGVRKDAPEFTIKAAFRALCREYHPDTYGGHYSAAAIRFTAIQEAYFILVESGQREIYDGGGVCYLSDAGINKICRENLEQLIQGHITQFIANPEMSLTFDIEDSIERLLVEDLQNSRRTIHQLKAQIKKIDAIIKRAKRKTTKKDNLIAVFAEKRRSAVVAERSNLQSRVMLLERQIESLPEYIGYDTTPESVLDFSAIFDVTTNL